jgi:hypothetical protein
MSRTVPPMRFVRKLKRAAFALGAFALVCTAAPHASPARAAEPVPTATPVQDPEAERDFVNARDWWRARTDAPYVRYGALVRYLHDGHVFDNWWDVYQRTADGALALAPLHDAEEENHRLRGVPFSIFGLKIFDTNRDAAPIRLDDPRIDIASSFGIVTRFGKSIVPRVASSPRSGASFATPIPQTTDDLREIGRIESNTRAYDIRIAGTEMVAGSPALHLVLAPIRDPKINRLRDLWLEPATFRTVQSRVQGILENKPYDGISWTVHYVLVEGRQYVQQVVADEPLHFGLDTTLAKFEFDFVDLHFPSDVPKFTFDRPF